jgi:hypothetical protein
MNLGKETHCDNVSSLKLSLARCTYSSYELYVSGIMSVDILVAEIAGCGVMKIPIHSVTSYAFWEEIFWIGGGIHVSVHLVVYFYIDDIKI